MLLQICEPLKVLIWDAESELLERERDTMRLSLLEGGLPALLRVQGTSSV